MKVILKDDIKSIGKAWEVVDVKDGFARNYLIPNKLAMLATAENLKVIEAEKKRRDIQKAKEKENALLVVTKLAGISCTIQASVGEEDKIYGSVTSDDIAKALLSEGIKVDKKQISVPDSVNKLGEYEAKIKLHPEVTADLKFWVVKG